MNRYNGILPSFDDGAGSFEVEDVDLSQEIQQTTVELAGRSIPKLPRKTIVLTLFGFGLAATAAIVLYSMTSAQRGQAQYLQDLEIKRQEAIEKQAQEQEERLAGVVNLDKEKAALEWKESRKIAEAQMTDFVLGYSANPENPETTQDIGLMQKMFIRASNLMALRVQKYAQKEKGLSVFPVNLIARRSIHQIYLPLLSSVVKGEMKSAVLKIDINGKETHLSLDQEQAGLILLSLIQVSNLAGQDGLAIPDLTKDFSDFTELQRTVTGRVIGETSAKLGVVDDDEVARIVGIYDSYIQKGNDALGFQVDPEKLDTGNKDDEQ